MNKFIKALFAVVFLAGLASCLKDTNYDNNVTGNNLSNVPKVIELATLVNPPYHDQALSLDFKDEEVTLTFLTIRLASNEPATEDINVTIDTSQAVLDAYNLDNGKDLVKLPDNIYTFQGSGLAVVIPKGARSATIEIKTNAINFDPSTTYGLAFKIGSIDKTGYVASGNFGTFVTSVGAKNDYDGIYDVSGTLVDVLNATFTPYPDPGWEAWVVTTGSNSNVVQIGEGGFGNAVGHPFITPTGPSYYGAFGMEFNFDPTTKKITSVVSPYVPAANTRYAQIDATYDSFFDPVTHDITVKYYMYQPSMVPAGPRTTFVEKWTYKGPR